MQRMATLVDAALVVRRTTRATYGVVAAGGLFGRDLPRVFRVAIALCASFARKPVGTVLVVVAVEVEALLYTVTEAHADLRPLALHAAFIVAFGLSHLVFTRAEIARVRRRGARVLAEEKARVA